MNDSRLCGRKVLILTDGKIGHENQSRAFARALGCGFDILPVRFKGKFVKAASYLLDHFGIGCLGFFANPPDVAALTAEGYAAVVGTGSGTFYAAKLLARRLGVRCGVVLYPRGYRISTFNCVLAPAFDRPAKATNVVEIPANLVAADAAFYEKGVADFLAHSALSRDVVASCHAVAVIVGGPNACSTMTVDWMKGQLDTIFASQPAGSSFWVTTSRRTPPDVEALVDSYPWNYKLIYSRDSFNPIPAFVSLAKKLYVTAESTGMLSEACTSGSAEVVALDNLRPGPSKFRRFVESLRAGGYVDGHRKIDISVQFASARQLMGL